VYVPVVPVVPGAREVIRVPPVTPAPEILSPTVRVPDATADTVNVVPATVAVNEAVPPVSALPTDIADMSIVTKSFTARGEDSATSIM